MQALGYLKAHVLADFAIIPFELPDPVIGEGDVLVEIKAIAVNPVDTKVRLSRSADGDAPVILGWDASGIIRAVGAKVKGFAAGDEVYYAGDLLRPGCNAQLQAVDVRLIAHKPKSLSFAEAAALPLTALTAYEMLFEQFALPTHAAFDVLIIGGAGGVGSIAIQLLKARTKGRVYSTSGRSSSEQWLKTLGVDGVLDRSKPLAEEMQALGIKQFDAVFSTTHSDQYLIQIPDILRPFGKFGLIDDPASLDVLPFKRKSIATYWEFMFAKSMWNHAPESQGKILAEVAALVDGGEIRSTAAMILEGMTPEHLQQAHTALEAGTAIGKIVLTQ